MRLQYKKKIVALFLIVACSIGILTLSGCQTVPEPDLPYEEANESVEVVENEITYSIEIIPAPLEIVAIEPEPEPEPEPPEIPIDFEALWEINPHVHGWITIPGTPVDYPILQSPTDEDQEFYLNHTIERIPLLEGSIFTQDYNRTDFTDRNTIIYGHDMLNESKFGSLRNYFNEYFRQEHEQIIIYTPDEILTYQIFGLVVYRDYHLMRKYEFDTDEGLLYFLEAMANSPRVIYWSEELEVTGEDTIITLSTCTTYWRDRFLVLAVLVEDD